MYKPVRNIFILTIGIVVVFVAGCAEQEPPTFRESRAIAAENIALNKEVDRLNNQIDELKKQHEQEMKQQKEALAGMTEEKEAWRMKAQKNIREQVKGVLDAVLESNDKLREENKQLKAQVEKFRNFPEPAESTDSRSTEAPEDSMEQ